MYSKRASAEIPADAFVICCLNFLKKSTTRYTHSMQTKEEIGAQIASIETQMASPDFWQNKDMAQEVLKEYQDLKVKLEGGGVYDKSDAIVSIISGAGGDDAEDFSRILFSMYQKYAASRGWKTALLDSAYF